MTDEAKALVEREGMQVLLPPASIDGDYLMGWLEGQSYLIENYGTDEAFDQAIAVANKVHKLQNLIETQAREIERLNAILSAMNDMDVIARTMAENERLRERKTCCGCDKLIEGEGQGCWICNSCAGAD